ncbi:hypothetical protein B0H17DRAFT_1182216 [Mycena rosella]|uniref:Uncharacterized protein n=1 Tax=Mycena rosella TaxID=1033263 RepID=A0AAD7G9D2_MYCRO|nr:hypothetical protein B0H17DRAFT_1182216 [Mycena rosella]
MPTQEAGRQCLAENRRHSPPARPKHGPITHRIPLLPKAQQRPLLRDAPSPRKRRKRIDGEGEVRGGSGVRGQGRGVREKEEGEERVACRAQGSGKEREEELRGKGERVWARRAQRSRGTRPRAAARAAWVASATAARRGGEVAVNISIRKMGGLDAVLGLRACCGDHRWRRRRDGTSLDLSRWHQSQKGTRSGDCVGGLIAISIWP